MIDPTMIDPRLDDRRALLRNTVIVLVVGVVVGGLLVALGRGMFRDQVVVTATIDDIGGALVTGNDVKLDGVIIGRVTSIEPAGGKVRLGLTIQGDDARRAPSDLRARVLPASVFGTTYVDLVAVSRDGGHLVAGQRIPQDDRQGTLELQDTLDSTDRIMSAVSPAELSSTLGALADALDGRGEKLGRTIETSNTLLGKVEPALPLLTEDLGLLARNLRTLDATAPDLLDAVDDGLVVADTVVAERAQITSLIAGGQTLVSDADRFVTGQEKQIVELVRQSAIVTDALHDNRRGLPDGILAFIDFGRKATGAFSDGPWLKTDARLQIEDVPAYTGADCPTFGSARGDNCSGGETSPTAVVPEAVDPDTALVSEISGMLDDLQKAAGEQGSVGDLLTRPYLGGGS